jgi:hypothetical protein
MNVHTHIHKKKAYWGFEFAFNSARVRIRQRRLQLAVVDLEVNRSSSCIALEIAWQVAREFHEFGFGVELEDRAPGKLEPRQ